MKSRRSGREMCRIKSPRNMTVPVSSETMTISRPVKSRSISRDIWRMRRASCASVMRMRSTSSRQRGGTVAWALAERETAVVCIGFSIDIPPRLPRNFSLKFQFQKTALNSDSRQQCTEIIEAKLRPRFHLITSRLKLLNRDELNLRDDLFVSLYLLRRAKQHMHNTEMNPPDFGRIVVD